MGWNHSVPTSIIWILAVWNRSTHVRTVLISLVSYEHARATATSDAYEPNIALIVRTKYYTDCTNQTLPDCTILSNIPTHGLVSWSASCCMRIQLAAYGIVICMNFTLTDWYCDMGWKRSTHGRMGWLVSCCMSICRLAARIVIYTNHTSTDYMNTRIWDEICRLTGRSMDRCICVTWLVYISRVASQCGMSIRCTCVTWLIYTSRVMSQCRISIR